ncbi:MAG: RimK family alpha-L-glutamate ligase [Betaproteobacteria bacterium]|nr:RimK family alpha-L-glutamate ligase [Betaproteobacteria bacterium]
MPAYIGFAGLWRLLLSGLEIFRLGPLLEAHLERNPDDAAAMMDMATLLILTLIPENRGPAFALQARALEMQQLYRLPAARKGAGLRVLAIASPGDMTAITHLDCLLEDSDVELLMLYARPQRPLPSPLPDHDLVFVSAGESVPNRPLLKQIESFTNASTKPVLNAPDRILRLSRDSVSALLKPVPGIVMPMTMAVGRHSLEQVGRAERPLAAILEDGVFPIIARPLDSQGGKDLAKLDGPAAIADYLRTAADGEFFVSRFVDYSAPDGLFRKYRVVLIAGRPYACHMAISTHWMIHYVNADMDASAAKRDEEARFMADFDTRFALRHQHSLAGIDALMGLDYYGIDCAETADERLLVFEVDTAMLVHAMDPPDLYPYKRAQMRKLFGAFRSMLLTAVESAGQGK